MTEHKSFKRLVRARMEKTGEAYTAARAAILAGKEKAKPATAAVMPISDGAIRKRTGRGWEEWFDRLDEAGAADRTHKEIAASLAADDGVDGWSSQAITVAYERARQGRAVGEKSSGFEVTASKTIGVSVERLFDAQKSTVALAHERLPDPAAAERMKAFWRERLAALKAKLER